MSQILVGILFAVLWLGAADNAFAQTSETAQKTQDLVASLGKTKYKKKEKKDFVVEVYVSITNEAVVKNNIGEYAGSYVCEDGDCRIELNIGGGRVEGSGFDTRFDGGKRQNFTLRDAKIEGALLTATKVYEGGRTEKLEAVFVNRTIVQGKNPNEIDSRKTSFGLGYVETNDAFTNRIFLEFKP